MAPRVAAAGASAGAGQNGQGRRDRTGQERRWDAVDSGTQRLPHLVVRPDGFQPLKALAAAGHAAPQSSSSFPCRPIGHFPLVQPTYPSYTFVRKVRGRDQSRVFRCKLFPGEDTRSRCRVRLPCVIDQVGSSLLPAINASRQIVPSLPRRLITLRIHIPSPSIDTFAPSSVSDLTLGRGHSIPAALSH